MVRPRKVVSLTGRHRVTMTWRVPRINELGSSLRSMGSVPGCNVVSMVLIYGHDGRHNAILSAHMYVTIRVQYDIVGDSYSTVYCSS